jgi:hypothetical protein
MMQAVLLDIALLHCVPREFPRGRVEEVVHVATTKAESWLAAAVRREQTFRCRLGVVGRRLGDTVRVPAPASASERDFNANSVLLLIDWVNNLQSALCNT